MIMSSCMRSAAALSLLLVCAGSVLGALARSPPSTAAEEALVAPLASKKVDVDLFVMSKCPDAVFCEAFLAPLLDELKYHINLQFHYIGLKQADGSWQCKHGDDECAGDLQQLCVQQFSAEYNRVNLLLNFILCNNRDGEVVGSFATATKCLKEVGAPVVDGTRMVACMYSPGRQAVLESDFAQTALLGAKTSCTIRIDGNDVCVRDGGEWKDCPAGSSLDNFKQLLCAAYAAKNKGQMPRTCQDVPTLAVA